MAKWLVFLQIIVLPAMLSVAWLLWQNDAISKKLVDGSISISSKGDLERFPPLLTKPLKQLLSQAVVSVNSDNAFILSVAREYIRRRPLDADAWVYASLFSQRLGNEVEAADYLHQAHMLSRTNSNMLMQVFNRYLELGLIDDAMPVAKDLVFAKPTNFRRLFYLLTRLNSNYSEVVKLVIPNIVPTHNDYEPDIYYRLALSDAIKAKNHKLAKAVWDQAPKPIRLYSRFGLAYLDYLVRLQKWQEVKAVWQGLTGNVIGSEQISNYNFEQQNVLRSISPCWRIRKNKSATWRLDDQSFTGKKSLLIEFNGEENADFHHLSCYVGVESGATYKLKGMWSGSGISTRSGPFIEVSAPSIKRFYQRTEDKIGSWPWVEFDLEFTVPKNVEVISIRIRRFKVNQFDSKISGKVWFDDFRLERTDTSKSDYEVLRERI